MNKYFVQYLSMNDFSIILFTMNKYLLLSYNEITDCSK